MKTALNLNDIHGFRCPGGFNVCTCFDTERNRKLLKEAGVFFTVEAVVGKRGAINSTQLVFSVA